MEQIICHLVGDYLLQNSWMALNKTKSLIAAICHCAAYTLPFIFLTQDPLILSYIFYGHVVIDYSGIVKQISDLAMGDCPEYQKWTIGIIRDNTVHLIFNYLVLFESAK